MKNNFYRITAVAFAMLCFSLGTFAQSYSAFTSYTWDNWQDVLWKYEYTNDGWVYAYPSYGNPKDFYFRYKYNELGLRELSRQEWKAIKQNQGWTDRYCTFEYYITDECQTMKRCLEKYSYPCAKARLYSHDKPSVLRSESVRTSVYYKSNNKVRTLNFHFSDGSGFAITVYWDYSGN